MSFYFTPNNNYELNFPVENSNKKQIFQIDQNKVNNEIDKEIDNNKFEADLENKTLINEKSDKFFHFKYNKNKLIYNQAKDKLNKIKIYILVKPVVVNQNTVNVAVPINNYEDLGNTGYSRALTVLSSTFLMRTAQDLAGTGLIEGSPGSRPFILEHAIGTEPPYETEEEVSLKNLCEGIYEKAIFKEEEKQKLLDPNKEILESVREEDRLGSGWDTQVLNSEVNREEDAMLDLEIQILEAAFGLLYYYSSPYEYDYSFLDNTIFTNSRPYPAQPRDEENFNHGIKGILNNLRKFDFEEQKNDLKVLFTESERILFKNTTELLSKNIIPVFCELEEAQNLLITVLEELTQPYRAIRPIESVQSTQKILDNITQGLDYIDDSFTLENRYIPTHTSNSLHKIKDFLKRYRLLSYPSVSFSSDDYSPDNYQLHGTKMRKFIYESWQLFFDEVEDLGKPYDYRKGPWDDTRCYLPKSDKKLLSIASEVKIISMGLGDFLEFWNNQELKNGELLFIPSLKSFKNKKFPFIFKKPKDQFYEYQQQFRDKGEENYNYNVTISSIP